MFAEDLAFLVAGTRFAKDYAVNGRPRGADLNRYFFCPPPEIKRVPASVRPAVGNCAYAGAFNTIVCDMNFLREFVVASKIADELPTVGNREQTLERATRAIFLWVLGYELGHVVARHKPAHFQADRLNDLVASASLDQKIELEADRWFVERVAGLPRGTRLQVEVLLLELLYAQVRAKVGSKNLHPATGVPITSQMIEYAESGSHPEFVIRATRMLALSFAQSPEEGAAAMKQQIDSFANGLRRKAEAAPGRGKAGN